MGIPRLTSLLHPYSSTVTFVSPSDDTNLKQKQQHQSRRLAVIDGPSLAYHVLKRILANRPKETARNAFEVVPDYQEIQDETLRVAEAFEACGFEM
jgi:hypothetical protein